MKNSAILDPLIANSSSLSVCWRVHRKDGTIILGTDHDRDITVSVSVEDFPLEGTYVADAGISASAVRSSADLSVDNMEVNGVLKSLSSYLDMSAQDIDAGLFDDALVVLFVVSWEQPDIGQLILRYGNLGNIKRTSEGQYTTELRGLCQRLAQGFVRTMEVECDADFGDDRCQAPVTFYDGEVTDVTNRRSFSVLIPLDSPVPSFIGGKFTFLTGANANYVREVKRENLIGDPQTIEFFEPFPNDIQVGDTFRLTAGCDKTIGTCIKTFDNVVNFRGYAVFTPTLSSQMAGPALAKSAQKSQNAWVTAAQQFKG